MTPSQQASVSAPRAGQSLPDVFTISSGLRLFDRTKEAVLSVQDVADLIGVSAKTIRKWMHAGKIPHRVMPSKGGQSYRFFLTEVVAWLDRRKGVKPR